ncbi:MAG: HD domain-containing phosphohydrolase [Knoellia sp.]
MLRYGSPSDWWAVGVLALLGAMTWWLPATSSDGRVHFTADNVVILAAIPIAGPVGCGLVSLVMTAATKRNIPFRRRLFNMAALSSSTWLSGIAYDVAGGSFEAGSLNGTFELAWHVGAPIVVADLALVLANALLVAGVIRLTAGVPLRLQVVDMLTSSGLTQFAYGIIAFLVVIMWLPGELGPVAILVALAPLAGARWALVLYGEERNARERALGALVTAIETRAPALAGHSARVSELAAVIAQDLGLGPQQVADIRTAGLLHDLGRVVVAPGYGADDEPTSAARRGAAMLQDLPFLSGASVVMDDVARADSGTRPPSMAAEIVLVSDRYDLMVHDEKPVSSTEAVARLTALAGGEGKERVTAALARAVRAHEDLGHEIPATS